MKCYTLDRPGIKVVDGKIFVGEGGRGRKLVAVPLPPQAKLEGETLVECQGDVTSALVYINDQSGFRGGWHMRHPRTESDWDIIVSVECSAECKQLWSGTHPECPKCSKLSSTKPFEVKVIAEGASAQGDAGRMGGGPEYLIVMKSGQAIEIVRSGRLYGAPAVVRLDCIGGQVTLTYPKALAEERLAASKWEELSEETGAEPVETVLYAPSQLRGTDGNVHEFCGQSIPGVVEVLEDTSIRSGYRKSRCERYRVALAAGVTLEEKPAFQPQPEPEPEPTSFGASTGGFNSLGDALKNVKLNG